MNRELRKRGDRKSMNNSVRVAMSIALHSTKWDSNSCDEQQERRTLSAAEVNERTYMKVCADRRTATAATSPANSVFEHECGRDSRGQPAQIQLKSSEAKSKSTSKSGRKNEDMKIFVSFKEESEDLTQMSITAESTVLDLKQMVQNHFKLRPILLPSLDDDSPTKAVLTVSYQGSDLSDRFRLVDVGISHGSIVKCYLKEEHDTLLFIRCAYSGELVRITDPVKLRSMKVADLKSLVSRKIGLPYSAFRMTGKDGREMFPQGLLIDCGVQVGDTINVETWDGFNDLINLSIMGFSEQALNTVVTNDEALNKYQTKLLLYIAAHYGHVDLAAACIKLGLKADEPIHEHPSRQWSTSEFHPDILKCPVHVCAEAGQLGVLRYFVFHDIGVIMKNDGYGAKPLNLVLRNRRTECVKFLLTRQWTRIAYANTRVTLTLNLYNRMKKWANRARERVFMIYGASKSSFNSKRKLILNMPRVGQDVFVKGHHQSRLNSREPTKLLQKTQSEIRTPDVVRARRTQGRLPPLTAATSSGFETTGTDTRVDVVRDRQSVQSAVMNPASEYYQSIRSSFASTAQPKKQAPVSKSRYNVKAKDSGLQLPLNPIDEFKRPFFHTTFNQPNMPELSISEFESIVGMKKRDLAIRCLSVAADFKSKTWVQRVRLALDMTRQIVKQRRSVDSYLPDEDEDDNDNEKEFLRKKLAEALELNESMHQAD